MKAPHGGIHLPRHGAEASYVLFGFDFGNPNLE